MAPWMSWGGPAPSQITAHLSEPPSPGAQRGCDSLLATPPQFPTPNERQVSGDGPVWEPLSWISYMEPRQSCPQAEWGPRAGRGQPSRRGSPRRDDITMNRMRPSLLSARRESGRESKKGRKKENFWKSLRFLCSSLLFGRQLPSPLPSTPQPRAASPLQNASL